MGVSKIFKHIPNTIQQAVLDESTRGGHHYITPENHKYPSITSILSRTKPDHVREKLAAWKARTGDEIAQYIMEESMLIGKQTHKLNECYLRMEESDDTFRLISHAHYNNFKPYLDKIDNIHGIEIRLYSDTLKIAGTADCIAEYNGVLSVIDYKTKRSSQCIDWLGDYFIQTVAYAKMYEELTRYPIKQLIVLVSSEANTIQEFVVKPEQYLNALTARLSEFNESR